MANKKRVLLLLALLIALACAVLAWLLFKPGAEPPAYGIELLKNGGFEAVTGEGLPEGWLPESYLNDPDVTAFSLSGGRDGGGIEITSRLPNDARYIQTVPVKPDAVYRFSGYIKSAAGLGLSTSKARVPSCRVADRFCAQLVAWQTGSAQDLRTEEGFGRLASDSLKDARQTCS